MIIYQELESGSNKNHFQWAQIDDQDFDFREVTHWTRTRKQFDLIFSILCSQVFEISPSFPSSHHNVAGCRFRAAASCHRRGVPSLPRPLVLAVSPSSGLGAEAAAGESVCPEHTLLRLLQLHPRQSGQCPGDLWPLRWDTPLLIHWSRNRWVTASKVVRNHLCDI